MKRLAPAEAPAEAVERLLPRRQLTLEDGDVLIRREPLPRVNPRGPDEPQWRFRVAIYPDCHGDLPFFTSFSHAAAHAEQLAFDTRARVMFVDDDVPTMIADHRRGRDDTRPNGGS